MPSRRSQSALPKGTSKKACQNATIKSKKVAPNPIKARKEKKERPCKPIFKDLTISCAGTLTAIKGPMDHEHISKWITYHGGKYERQVTDYTTHLICSIEEYVKAGPQVKSAWKRGSNCCKIVVFDWLEDCLQGPKGKKRLLKETPYTLDRTIIQLKKRKAGDLPAYRKRFEDSVRVSKELCDSKLYHIYYEPEDGFEYKVMLSRIRLDGQTMIEKYTLYLFESHNKSPPLYMFGAKFSRTHRPLTYYRQDCHPMDFHTAFTCFKKFFKSRSGVDWDLRLERIIPKDEENGEEKLFFKYSPPVRGRPVGSLPWGYVRPEDRMAPMEDTKNSNIGDEQGQSAEEVGYDTNSEVDEDEDQDSNLGSDGTTSSVLRRGQEVISISSGSVTSDSKSNTNFSSSHGGESQGTPRFFRGTPNDGEDKEMVDSIQASRDMVIRSGDSGDSADRHAVRAESVSSDGWKDDSYWV